MGAVTEFIRELQSYEEYSFSTEELYQRSLAPESSIKKELARLASNNQIINLRKGFYIIIPPNYQHYKRLPLELYVEKLFRSLGKQYYVGYYSAATIHGAAHQQIQKDYIITSPPPLRDISKGSIKIRFFNSIKWPEANILQKKSNAGYFNVSSPALTFVDLLENQNNLGGINRMLAILEELSEALELQDLKILLTWYSNKSTLQRMGYIMEEMDLNTGLAEAIFEKIQENSYFPVLLSPGNGQRPGSTGNRWKVDVNVELESDL